MKEDLRRKITGLFAAFLVVTGAATLIATAVSATKNRNKAQLQRAPGDRTNREGDVVADPPAVAEPDDGVPRGLEGRQGVTPSQQRGPAPASDSDQDDPLPPARNNGARVPAAAPPAAAAANANNGARVPAAAPPAAAPPAAAAAAAAANDEDEELLRAAQEQPLPVMRPLVNAFAAAAAATAVVNTTTFDLSLLPYLATGFALFMLGAPGACLYLMVHMAPVSGQVYFAVVEHFGRASPLGRAAIVARELLSTWTANGANIVLLAGSVARHLFASERLSGIPLALAGCGAPDKGEHPNPKDGYHYAVADVTLATAVPSDGGVIANWFDILTKLKARILCAPQRVKTLLVRAMYEITLRRLFSDVDPERPIGLFWTCWAVLWDVVAEGKIEFVYNEKTWPNGTVRPGLSGLRLELHILSCRTSNGPDAEIYTNNDLESFRSKLPVSPSTGEPSIKDAFGRDVPVAPTSRVCVYLVLNPVFGRDRGLTGPFNNQIQDLRKAGKDARVTARIPMLPVAVDVDQWKAEHERRFMLCSTGHPSLGVPRITPVNPNNSNNNNNNNTPGPQTAPQPQRAPYRPVWTG
jgi:hypothetical protein